MAVTLNKILFYTSLNQKQGEIQVNNKPDVLERTLNNVDDIKEDTDFNDVKNSPLGKVDIDSIVRDC